MKYFSNFDEHNFLRSVQAALNQVSKILDKESRPVRLLAANETEHTYEDKFVVAENVTTTLKETVKVVLREALGLKPEHQPMLDKWRKNNDVVTIRFAARDSCTFLNETEVEVKNGTIKSEVKTTGGFLHGTSTKTQEVTSYRTLKEYHWKVQVDYKLSIYAGNDERGGITLLERTSETVLATRSRNAPLSASTIHPVLEAPLTWFLDSLSCTIDRSVSHPITPRRNEQVQDALEAADKFLSAFVVPMYSFFVERLQKTILDQDQPVVPRTTSDGTLSPGTTGTVQGLKKNAPTFNGKRVRVLKFAAGRYEVEPLDANDGLPNTIALKPENIVPDQAPSSGTSLTSITDETVIVPIVPVLDDDSRSTTAAARLEHARSLRQAMSDLALWYPNARLVKLVTAQEASLVLASQHLGTLVRRYKDAVAYLEATLRQQLVTAIGQHVRAREFQSYMQYHFSRRLFGQGYQPVPFCRAVRRPGCFPDGTLALEQLEGSSTTPVATWVRTAAPGGSFFIPIHAAASVELTGPAYLHGWMQHRFGGEDASPPKFQLACRARQFSSFLVILGTIAGSDQLDPQHAIVVQNKDELLIPLLADPLPSAREFRDAISSLSPEQQEFAKEFRGMQLSSSVFGVSVIQLKPQLEKLLGIPDKGLTKEIQLTQDLMSLFIDYQIPSDMLTYEGPSDSPAAEKIAAIKGHTKAVLDVIQDGKKKQLKEEEMRADMRHEFGSGGPPAIPLFGGAPMPFASQARAFEDELSESAAMPIQERKGRRSMKKKSSPTTRGSEPVLQSCVVADDAPTRKSVSQQPPLPANGTGDTIGSDSVANPQNPFLGSSLSAGVGVEDFTTIPRILDGKLERLDTDGALRSTIVSAGEVWTRSRQENLLIDPTTSSLRSSDIGAEKKKAFDLLDAISRSGTLAIECSELHVFVAVSHCFEKDVMGTVIEDNVNPISKVERSALLLASTTFGVEASNLIGNGRDTDRLTTAFPQLFNMESSAIDQA